jgi:glutamine---fructose-6-phosphate transaminase (isomerizing)
MHNDHRSPLHGRYGRTLMAAIKRRTAALADWLRAPVFWGRCPVDHRQKAWILLPQSATTLCCGLAGLVSIQRQAPAATGIDISMLESLIQRVQTRPLASCILENGALAEDYLGGDEILDRLYTAACDLKHESRFLFLFEDFNQQAQMSEWAGQLSAFARDEVRAFEKQVGLLSAPDAEKTDARIEKLRDAAWCLKAEVLDNIHKTKALLTTFGNAATPGVVKIYYNINTVLNSIDRLEVRGRDSAGISLLFVLTDEALASLKDAWTTAGLADQAQQRMAQSILGNQSINIHPHGAEGTAGIMLTYKVASEIGSLGDNVRHLRQQIANDPILDLVVRRPHLFHTVSAHTRWASVGAITIANCHPVDNATKLKGCDTKGMIHACLNGDIDNHMALKQQCLTDGDPIAEEITTDTKVIPMQIEYYLRQSHPMEEAFRLAVNDFEGSHAIAVHTDLAPGKFFLAQKGSGQAVFVGLAADHYLATSEVYGFVEKTDSFLKLNGEKIVQGINGPTQGQIFILDQNSPGGLEGVRALCYDGSPIALSKEDIQRTRITSRDIDRQGFPHYFLKEISEAPLSVARTLQNRWKVAKDDPERYTIALPESAFPQRITQALMDDRIRRIYIIGQGTAGIAAQAIADILNHYLNEPSLKISALKASELSGFQLGGQGNQGSMDDALVIAISQSGTTTDTNRAVDMVRQRGALAMAIVNRRDSDLTFKVDGVVYTSSGRDIEMSVASTKAFYSQIVAGALISLKIAVTRQRRSAAFVADEVKALLELPDQMRKVLGLGDAIRLSAERLAPSRIYWAAVGSGPNKAAADEIRIKLSELCYKTISSDYVEDKKHIDLSAEPLILICAAGAPGPVIGDLVKDTAIFRAHKAAPIVITDEGETRFDAYAEDVFQVPVTAPHLAPILNTLVGHLWGYYAALAINSGSHFMHQFRETVRQSVDQYARDGLDVYEMVLEKNFREKIIQFYTEFRQRLTAAQLPGTIRHAADLLLLLKYLAGRLPVSDFELDFGKRGTALNMLDSLFQFLGETINGMSRPVDAIKHQAKTVTVGTSRISEKIEGLLFDALEAHGIHIGQLINRNILVLKNLQQIVGSIQGSILYRIDGLDLLGEPSDATTIEIIRKEGILKNLTSRVETDKSLKGSKRIVVRQGNVYIGKGRKDDRSIILIPAFSADPAASNRIEHLLLLNIRFQEQVALGLKIKALGGKYENIKSIVQENSVAWTDTHLEKLPMEELFGRSAEKVAEMIVLDMKKAG